MRPSADDPRRKTQTWIFVDEYLEGDYQSKIANGEVAVLLDGFWSAAVTSIEKTVEPASWSMDGIYISYLITFVDGKTATATRSYPLDFQVVSGSEYREWQKEHMPETHGNEHLYSF